MEVRNVPIPHSGNIEPELLAEFYDIVVFSHLRWDFVFQRPQHILSRMAKTNKILFVEEPIGFDHHDEGAANITKPINNLRVLKPKVSSIDEISGVLKQYIANDTIPVGWFYSGAFVSLLDHFSFEQIVYDCMDELSLFKGADSFLIEQEKQLLAQARIVFTGGKSLYESKRAHHANVHCFPSSVDSLHFEKAKNGIEVPKDINRKYPVIGYYGVIDERIDLELLQQTAALLPNISFVMIGPLAKISADQLPSSKNIHFMGMRSYEELPAYLKAFDIAMMPFALNDATRFISPTKTLEYIAGGKPVISTPVYDVVRDYTGVVSIISTAEEFANEIQHLLSLSLTSQSEMEMKYDKIIAETSWDKTVEKMNSLIKSKSYEEQI